MTESGNIDELRRRREAGASQRPRQRGLSNAELAQRRKVMRFVTRWRTYGVFGFGALLLVGCLLGLLVFLRPTTSEVENRTLTEMPPFTIEGFMDGSFFSEASLWYSDTYPLREQMVSADLSLESLYGVVPETRMIGGNRTSDELPVVDENSGQFADDAGAEDLAARAHVDLPDVRVAAKEMETQISDGIYTDGKAAYTLYYFSKEATRNYANLINDAAKLLEGKAQVYSILLPTNGGVMLDDEVLAQLGVPNQDQAIDYFYSLMSSDVKTVPTFDTLYEHRDEYLYFRTDFHWTQLAAYYVYESFCKEKGIEPAPYFEWEELVFDDYVGEYADMIDIGNIQADYVSARIPQGTNTVEYWKDDSIPSAVTEAPVIADLNQLKVVGDKYSCFIGGNRPLTHINNPNVTDGSSCLVVKDSVGNPLVSTMVDNYQDIYCIDFRYTTRKLVDLVEEHGIKDVIFENVLMFAGTNNCASLLTNIIYPEGTSAEDLLETFGPKLPDDWTAPEQA